MGLWARTSRHFATVAPQTGATARLSAEDAEIGGCKGPFLGLSARTSRLFASVAPQKAATARFSSKGLNGICLAANERQLKKPLSRCIKQRNRGFSPTHAACSRACCSSSAACVRQGREHLHVLNHRRITNRTYRTFIEREVIPHPA